jgi:DNA-binding GntR family transcriptional regulator
MSNEALARYGISRHTKIRALRQLEATGLVTIEHHPGKAIVVRLLA